MKPTSKAEANADRWLNDPYYCCGNPRLAPKRRRYGKRLVRRAWRRALQREETTR